MYVIALHEWFKKSQDVLGNTPSGPAALPTSVSSYAANSARGKRNERDSGSDLHTKHRSNEGHKISANPATLSKQDLGLPARPSVKEPDMPVGMSVANGRSAARPKFALLKDVADSQFCDIIAEVVKKHTNSYGECELYFSDYTSNNLFYDYKPPGQGGVDEGRPGDVYGYTTTTLSKWPGPYGKFTIQAKLFPPHGIWANDHVHAGDFVSVKNMRIKYQSDKLEGVLHGDKSRPEQVNISKAFLRDPRVDALKERRLAYLDQAKVVVNASTCRAEGSKKLKKSKKREKKRREREAIEAAQRPVNTHGTSSADRSNGKQLADHCSTVCTHRNTCDQSLDHHA